MIRQKLVFIHALRILGHMLRILLELAYSDVLTILMDKIILGDVYQAVPLGEHLQIIQQLFALVVVLQTRLLIL